MVEPACRLSLSAETRPKNWIIHKIGSESLYRYRAPELQIETAINLRHPSSAEDLANVISALWDDRHLACHGLRR
jgi:hypothetical protein